MVSLAGRNAVFSIAVQIWTARGGVGARGVRAAQPQQSVVVAMSQSSQLWVGTAQPNAAIAMHNGNAFMDNTQQAHQRGWGLRRRGWPCWKRRVRGAIWVARGGSGCELPTIELVLPFRSVGGVRQIRLRFGIGPVSEKNRIRKAGAK